MADTVPGAKVRPPKLTGTRRGRLLEHVTEGPPGLRLVHAPAGAGKTTVLAHAAERWEGRVVWITADGTDRTGDRFARVLEAAVELDAASLRPGPDAALDVCAALEASAEPVLFVVDDAHELVGAWPAEALELLGRYRPPQMTLVIGARRLQGLERWRFGPGADVRELDGDALRFRLWEVDSLFRDHYGSPLGSQELHGLAHLTDGWAVALHLFHVATRTLPAADRRRLVSGPRLTARSIRDYLTGQVLATVEPAQRTLLRRAAVFDRVRPDRCDMLLGSSGSGKDLRALADIGLLVAEPDGMTFRLHDLVRAHLLTELEEELGANGLVDVHLRAAEVLEDDGDVLEAVRARGRSGDWDGVRRLLALKDAPVVATGAWSAGVPPGLRDSDPWVLRAVGRRQLGDGDLQGAQRTLRACLARFQEDGGGSVVERELRTLDGWLSPDPGQRRTWTECLRAALNGESVERWPDDGGGWLAAGLSELAGGRLMSASELLRQSAASLTGDLATVAELGLALTCVLGDPEPATAVEGALSRARSGDAWALTSLAETLSAYASGLPMSEELASVAEPDRSDPLVAGLHWLLVGLSLLEAGRPATGPLSRATASFRASGVEILARWAQAATGIAHAVAPSPSTAEPSSEVPLAALRAAGPLPHALALLSIAIATGDPEPRTQARSLANQHGFGALLARIDDAATRDDTDRADAEAAASPGVDAGGCVRIGCLGDLHVERNGATCDLGQLRPRHQDLLALLALQPGAWIHRERLVEDLWPEVDPERAVRNLQVAVSAVRRLLEPDAPAGHPELLVRSGERYQLALPPQCSDVGRLRTALSDSRAALRRGEPGRAIDLLGQGLDECHGEPVPAAGPADWAVEARRTIAHEVGKVAVEVLELLAGTELSQRAAELAARAVEVAPSEDRLWHLAITAASETGCVVLATSLEERYRSLVG